MQYADDSVEIVRCAFAGRGLSTLDAGIVERCIQASEARDNLGDEALDAPFRLTAIEGRLGLVPSLVSTSLEMN
jgi:hypothetical protein